jgi:hypothetical protein
MLNIDHLFRWSIVFQLTEYIDPSLGAFAKLRKANVSFFLSVRSHGTTRLPPGQIFMKVDIWVFFENLSRQLKFH